MIGLPGDYLLARGHDNKLHLSVKSNEPGNPTVHFPIEFCQTKQVIIIIVVFTNS